MISRWKKEVLKVHLLHERSGRAKPYVYRPTYDFFHKIMSELEESGLIEVVRDGDQVRATRITPAGALCYIRAVNKAVSKRGRDYFKDFIRDNPDFLDRCGPIQRTRIEKYLVLGFMPSFSKKPSPSGQ